MLFKIEDLKRIKSGDISLAIRKWKSPRVRKGLLIKSPIGQIEILDIFPVEINNVNEEDAIAAGRNLTELRNSLNERPEGTIYKVYLSYHSPDPRVALREQSELSDLELEQIYKKLKKFDGFGKYGPWTLRVLQVISDRPQTKAADLAKKLDYSKEWLKPNIRKLKNLGLTISHEIGYSISARGKVFLAKLKEGGFYNQLDNC
jgi:biotin operon repressor